MNKSKTRYDFSTLVKNVLIDAADDCYLAAKKEKNKDLEKIAKKLDKISEGEIMALSD